MKRYTIAPGVQRLRASETTRRPQKRIGPWLTVMLKTTDRKTKPAPVAAQQTLF